MSDNTVVSEFQQFVKLRDLPKLHPETTNITGITQAQVDAGATLGETLKRYHAWLEENSVLDSKRFTFATCGDWDLGKMLPKQCTQEGVERPKYFDEWINVKEVFSKFYSMKRQVSGMAAMLKYLKMDLLGRHHSGIDDCRNIARIIQHIVKEGCVMKNTGKLKLK